MPGATRRPQHTLRMLELIGRTDVPVAPGAVFPLVRTQQETRLESALVRQSHLARRLGPGPDHPHPDRQRNGPHGRRQSIDPALEPRQPLLRAAHARRRAPHQATSTKTPPTSSSARCTPTPTRSPSLPQARSPTSRSPSRSTPTSPSSLRASSSWEAASTRRPAIPSSPPPLATSSTSGSTPRPRTSPSAPHGRAST